MLTLDDEQIRHLAIYHDTLGNMLLNLAFHPCFEDGGIDVEPRQGWMRCDAGLVARQRYGDRPMQGYTQKGSGIVLTLVKIKGETHIHAEGAGWALETDGPYSGWAESGHHHLDEWNAIPSLATRFEHVLPDPPWHFGTPGRSVSPDEGFVLGPDGMTLMDPTR